MRMFIVMEYANVKDATTSWLMPWAVVEQWRRQIEAEHRQTLETLYRRGGLGPDELWCAAHNVPMPRGSDMGTIPAVAECREWLRAVAADYVAPSHWPHLLARVVYVPGMCAAISEREWEESADGKFAVSSQAALDEARPAAWPSWARPDPLEEYFRNKVKP